MRFVHPDLEKLIDSGATVVTPSPLLAAVIQKQYGSLQLTRQRKSWQQPAILSLSAWFQQTWALARRRTGKGVPALLTAAQERLLWQNVIRPYEARMLEVATTASAAASAVRTAAEWEIPFDDVAWNEHEDALALQSWERAARSICAEQGWMVAAEMWRQMPEWLGEYGARRLIVFAGFGPPAPALRSLSSRLKDIGFEVAFADSVRLKSEVASIPCASRQDELEMAARWSRVRLQETPEASIAILVPSLRENLGAVQRAFGDVLRPASVLDPVLDPGTSEQSIFHIHRSARLREAPVIATALALLDFALPQIPMASISLALSSPYLGGSRSESTNRALADARLRHWREMELTLPAVESATRDCASLSGMWPRLRRAIAGLPEGGAEASEWSRFTTDLLKAAGWPGDEDLTTVEQEAIEQWQQVLSTLASLGFVQRELTWEEAFYHLNLLTAADGPSIGDQSSPIQILEPTDAPAFRFDQAWLVGAAESDWPPLEFSSSFIPLSLQRAAGIPTATPAGRREAEREFTFAVQHIANTLCVSFSPPTPSVPASLSPLFLNARASQREDLHVWNGKVMLQQIRPVKLEETEDTQGPPVQLNGYASGGTHLLKSQSACPFQAFARWRLLADTVDEAVFSYDHRDRGTFLHDALARVWAELANSQRLRSLTGAELTDIVKRSVTGALSSDKVATPFREQLRLAEAERLAYVIHNWLELEKKRTSDFEVLITEKESAVQISGLSMRLRADRIDKLDDGKLVIIDYKSGRPKRGDLDGRRPNEPQLLVYAAALGLDVDGLYFAKLRAREEAAIGYGRLPHFGDKCEVPERDWQTQLTEWSDTVHRLAQQFEAGDARVDPLKKACDYCAMKSICRIAETRKQQAEDTEA